MKHFFNIFFVIVLFQSCQIVDDASPSPEDAYIKYYGELTSYEAKDIELVTEGGQPSGLVVLGTQLNPDPAIDQLDFYVLLTDLNGDTIRSKSFGLTVADGDVIGSDTLNLPDLNQDGNDNDVIRGSAISGKITAVNSGFFVTGTMIFNGQHFLAVVSLNANLDIVEFVLREADGANTNLELHGNDFIQLAGGGIVIVGKEENLNGGQNFDSYIIKIDNSGVVFEKSIGVAGTGEDEEAIRVFEKANRNLVLIGSGFTNSRLGENNGNNGQNAYFIELDPNGNPVNSRYYGVDDPDPENTAVFNETVTNAIEVPSGYIIVGTSTTSQNETYGFIISLDHNGGFISRASLQSTEFVGTDLGGLQTRFMGVTQARDNELVIVGQYPAFTSNGIGKSGEALFMKVDQALIPVPGNESNFGLTDGNDEFVDAVTLPDGSIVVVGNIDFGAGTKLISVVKLNDTGNLED